MRNKISQPQITKRSDVWVGLFFAISGAAVALEANHFPGEAWRMPFFLAVSLAGLGAGLVLQSSFVTPKTGIGRELIYTIVLGPLPIGALLLGWAFLLKHGFGFIEVSIPMTMSIIYLMGHRRIVLNALCSCAIVGLIFLMFYVSLGVLLPLGMLSAFL